jgi:hypothetical protein
MIIPWMIGVGLLVLCVLSAWLIIRRMVITVVEEFQDDRARRSFRWRRERLELQFLRHLQQDDPIERLRWEDASWNNKVYWARERSSRRLLALVGVEFNSLEGLVDPQARRATAVFEFRDGQWTTQGRFVNAAAPAEACRRDARLESACPPGEAPEPDFD